MGACVVARWAGSWATSGAPGESSAAAVSIEGMIRVCRIGVMSQKRKRACIVTRRMLPAATTSPKVSEFTAVLMEVKFT